MLDRLNRHDLTNEEWERLRVLLPSGPQQRGGRWADHRTVINGIFFRTRAGCPWRDLPEGFGNWKTGARPRSTPADTPSATRWNAASASSSSSAPSLSAMTSASGFTRAPSTSPRSASGYVIPSHDPRDTP